MTSPIYLDYNATTPVAPQVLEAMLPFLREEFGNPSSSHAYGMRAADALRKAREQVAALVNSTPEEIIFCGCATEANNLAILGVARALAGAKRHAVTTAIEHPSVMGPMSMLRDEGWEVSIVEVDRHGCVDPGKVAAALRPDTALVSVMHANNETGSIQPVAEIARLARARGVLVHTDAAQSAGKIPVSVEELGTDLLTLAGHKFYAPKGVGALYLRSGTPISPLFAGGGQERGLRSGTENMALIVALGEAAALARRRLPELGETLRRLRDRFHELLVRRIPGLELNGHPEHRLPNTLNVSFPRVPGAALLAAVADDVAASTGSACHSDDVQASGVLGAMGLSAERAAGAVRLSLGPGVTEEDVERSADALAAAWARLSR